MPNYFVSGAAGFVGQHLIAKLLENKDNFVTGYDNLFRGKLSNIVPYFENKQFKFIEGDIRDYQKLSDSISEYDSEIVFHLAAQSNVLGSSSNPDYCFQTNIEGTYNVLKACVENRVEKIIFSSSREVYGDRGVFPVKEDCVLNGKNMYAASKIAGEALCNIFRNNHSIDINILRFSNVYGNGDFDRVIPDWIAKSRNKEEIPIYGGNQIIDFIYIDYVIDALISSSAKRHSFPINVGSGQGTSILRLSDYFKNVLDICGEYKIYPARKMESTGYIADTTRMKEFLNVIPPKDSLEDIKRLL